jgi:hypothetical protein
MSPIEIHAVKTEDDVMLDFAFFPPRYVDDFIFVITHGAAVDSDVAKTIDENALRHEVRSLIRHFNSNSIRMNHSANRSHLVRLSTSGKTRWRRHLDRRGAPEGY